jgi:dCTP diphosphatase
LTPEQSTEIATDPKTARAVRDELADVLLYTVRLASVLGVDLDSAVQDKLRSNAVKYPVWKAHCR